MADQNQRPFVVRLTDEQIERLASAAFEMDRKGGHHKNGPWTWHMIPAQGRENYRALVRGVLNELDRIEGRLMPNPASGDGDAP